MKGILENLYRLQTLDSTGKNNDPAQTAGLRAWELWRSQIRAQVNW